MRQIIWLSAALLIPLGAVAAPNPQIDPMADAQMRRMSDYLTSRKSFRFRAESATDLVTPEGQKIQFLATQRLALKRPHYLRTDRQGPVADVVARYDGQTFSVYGKRTGYYATIAAPADLSQTIDLVRDRLGIDAPAADLLVDDPYAELMPDVRVGRYIGVEPVNGIQCHHLAFQGENVDWQIWIEDGPRPVPHRYTIVSKKENAAPEFSIELTDWQVNVPIPTNDFVFRPPPGDTRIEFQPPGRQTAHAGQPLGGTP